MTFARLTRLYFLYTLHSYPQNPCSALPLVARLEIEHEGIYIHVQISLWTQLECAIVYLRVPRITSLHSPMADCEPWIDTEPSTWVKNNNAANSHSFNETHNQLKAGLPGGASKQTSSDNADPVDDLVDYGLFAKLVPQNRSARDALSRLTHSPDNTYQHHRQFINIDPRTDGNLSERTDCFVFSLGLLPQFPSLGWRIGKGRPKISNLAVDILLPDGDGVAGVHGRFCWIKGSGGFFIIADNLRGQPVIMNGERLQHTQRLIPYRNAIAFGECYFSVQFETRSPAQDEQFQVELAAFYTRVLQDSAPLVLPTPSEHEIRIGNWIVRNPIASGAFGRVSFVTHAHTGLPAAMKELWQTPRNSLNVKREVIMAKMLKNLKHVSTSTWNIRTTEDPLKW